MNKRRAPFAEDGRDFCAPQGAAINSAAPPLRIIAEPVLGRLHHVYKRAA